MIAKLENIGHFQICFTLSCGDMSWDENFSSFLVPNSYMIDYFIDEKGVARTEVKKQRK